jgi:phosphonate dehydrogenase
MLVNPARGSIVDEAAVAAGLDECALGGDAADAFEMEDCAHNDQPRSINQHLPRHPRTGLTPHLGSAVSHVRGAIHGGGAATCAFQEHGAA